MYNTNELIYRAKGYYRAMATSPGAETIIYSGHTTEEDAHRILDKMLSSGLVEEAHIEIHVQGHGWVRESEKAETCCPPPTFEQRAAAIGALKLLKAAIAAAEQKGE